MATEGGPIHFLNIEYFFRIIYETVLGIKTPGFHMDLLALLTNFWLIVTAISTQAAEATTNQ